jgi:SNF2 family DNA or RNA helicase
MELFNYQKESIDFALRKRRTYMMIDLGLGKTAIALKAIEYTRKPALVFAPVKVALNTWVSEIKKWTPNLSYVVFHGPKKDKLLSKEVDIYILPYSSLKWFYHECCDHKFKLRKFFTVYDESTFIKSWTTDRWKKYVKRMLPINGIYRMCLSATPVPNGLIDLWTQYFVLDEGRSLGAFPTKYRDRFFIYTGAPRYQTFIKEGAEKEIHTLIRPITKRLDRNDYLMLPHIRYNEVVINTPTEIIKSYARLRRDSTLELPLGLTATALNEAGKSNKLRQLAQGALYTDGLHEAVVLHRLKAEALKEMVDGLNGQPVLVPVQFKFDYNAICKVFRQQLPVIRGGTSERKAMDYINKWNRKEIPVLLCHPQSLGHGVNLQHGGHNIIWYALPWSLDHFKQLNGRLDRTGQKHGVIVNVLMLDLPIERKVFRVLRSKNATQQQLLNAIRREVVSDGGS